ncbi:MAG: helix-turn-helix domain-containing protein [Actinobacteria bacterium]|nr:helix-turn-helix domain-containing protein [Actinomycetota bacterium]
MDLPIANNTELIQPTRAKIFAMLAELRRPAPTDEIADELGLHPNGVRIHLERMQSAGLVERRRERQARGRPRDIWSVSPGALPGGDPPTAYSDLGRWLVKAITSAKVGVEEVEEAGMRIGRDMNPEGDDETAEQRLFNVFTALGFRPEREFADDGKLTYCLGNCPYRDVVRERQALVCSLHRGMTRGLIETLGEDGALAAFVPKDPDEAGCLITVEGPIAESVPAQETGAGEGAGAGEAADGG